MAKLDGIQKIGSEKITALSAVETEKPTLPNEVGSSKIDSALPVPPPTGENYESLFPEPTVSISSPPAWIWWLLLVIAAIAIGLLGYYVANGRLNQWLSVPASSSPLSGNYLTAPVPPATTTAPLPSPSPALSTAIQPSPSATPVISAIFVRVLNGTQVAGAASAVADLLRQANLSVSSIGNAASRTHTSTVIYYQTGKLGTAQNVQKILSNFNSTLQESSTETGTDTVVVVLGPRQ